jgi:hypothetical protein
LLIKAVALLYGPNFVGEAHILFLSYFLKEKARRSRANEKLGVGQAGKWVKEGCENKGWAVTYTAFSFY